MQFLCRKVYLQRCEAVIGTISDIWIDFGWLHVKWIQSKHIQQHKISNQTAVFITITNIKE